MADRFDYGEKAYLIANGAIAGLEKLAVWRPEGEPEFERDRAFFLGKVALFQISEAESELTKLTAAFTRLKQLATAFKSSGAVKKNDPRIAQFKNDLKAIDGWTVSLLETTFTMLAFYDGQTAAKAKLASLTAAMTALMSKQEQEMYPMLKDPSLFKSYIG